jgi:methylated-DNA-[protein]-cysteine S-methyltransferase
MNPTYWSEFQAPWGPIVLQIDSLGRLQRIELRPGLDRSQARGRRDELRCAPALSQLQEYFDGRRRSFTLDLSLTGTPFRQKVWRALTTIPYGQTSSYRDIGRAIGQATAARAVGNANGANPIPIVIPCHRVIASDGSLGGFTGGLGIKRALLDLELSRLAA